MHENERLKAKNSFDGSILFKDQDFEKMTGRTSHRKNLDKADEYFNQFLNKETNEFDDRFVEKRLCPVCESTDNFRKLFIKKGSRHVLCNECGMVFISPALKELYLLKYYENDDSWLKVLENPHEIEIDSKKYQYAVDVINSFSEIKRKTVLDIGCARGLFLDIVDNNGCLAYGLEINKDAIKDLKKKKIQHWNRLEYIISDNKTFDVITMWDLFEHLYQPGAMLENLKKVLNDKGILFINIPNVMSLSSRILQEKSGTFDGRCHINFFSEHTITKILNKYGFNILDIETVVTEIKTISNYLNFDHPYSPEQKHSYFSLLTPEIIHGNKWGSRLLVYAQKS